MPSQCLPSLSSLHAFEVAARRLTVKNAGRELAVTHGAISQKIRPIEKDLGGPLVKRAPRSLSVTDAGRHLHPDITESSRRLRDAVDRVLRRVSAKQKDETDIMSRFAITKARLASPKSTLSLEELRPQKKRATGSLQLASPPSEPFPRTSA